MVNSLYRMLVGILGDVELSWFDEGGFFFTAGGMWVMFYASSTAVILSGKCTV